MGEYDGAKVCELIDIYMLYVIGKSTIQKIFAYTKMTGQPYLKTQKIKIQLQFLSKKACK